MSFLCHTYHLMSYKPSYIIHIILRHTYLMPYTYSFVKHITLCHTYLRLSHISYVIRITFCHHHTYPCLSHIILFIHIILCHTHHHLSHIIILSYISYVIHMFVCHTYHFMSYISSTVTHNYHHMSFVTHNYHLMSYISSFVTYLTLCHTYHRLSHISPYVIHIIVCHTYHIIHTAHLMSYIIVCHTYHLMSYMPLFVTHVLSSQAGWGSGSSDQPGYTSPHLYIKGTQEGMPLPQQQLSPACSHLFSLFFTQMKAFGPFRLHIHRLFQFLYKLRYFNLILWLKWSNTVLHSHSMQWIMHTYSLNAPTRYSLPASLWRNCRAEYRQTPSLLIRRLSAVFPVSFSEASCFGLLCSPPRLPAEKFKLSFNLRSSHGEPKTSVFFQLVTIQKKGKFDVANFSEALRQ